MKVYRTRNSTYEVDKERKLIRRIEGKYEPTECFGQDFAWQPYAHVFMHSGSLVIAWPLKKAAELYPYTTTSLVQEVTEK